MVRARFNRSYMYYMRDSVLESVTVKGRERSSG